MTKEEKKRLTDDELIELAKKVAALFEPLDSSDKRALLDLVKTLAWRD